MDAGVAPSFVGGIVVLHGTYDDNILGNSGQSAGGAFVWAQEVPDPSSAIKVKAAAPLINRNVTASKGGGVGNVNGNVWAGNVTNNTPGSCIPA